MRLGWIDFSDRDRRKAMDIIHLLQEQEAIDELGIGTVRDGFANIFFPGSSTIQTRAKYFFIVPYAIKSCCDNPRFHNAPEVRRALDDLERACADIMKDQPDRDGVIGADVLSGPNPKWVVRRPSSIYWNGIRTLGILTNRYMSIDECIRESVARRGKENVSNWMEDGEENEQDDRDAGHEAQNPLWNLRTFSPLWRDGLSIALTPDEAAYLREAISGRLDGSLYKYILDNNISPGQYTSIKDLSFRALYDDVKDDVPARLGHLMQLAVRTDTLIYMCRVLFNRSLSEDRNPAAVGEWNRWNTEDHLSEIRDLDLDEVFTTLRLPPRRVKAFLTDMRRHILSGDTGKAMNRLEEHEVGLKGEKRSKLRRRNEFKDDVWIGGGHLDYRLLSAARIIKDIYAAEGRVDV